MSSGPITCQNCSEQPAAIKRPKDGSALCKTCFIAAFELLVHQTIIDNKLFSAGEKIAVAASGGKDSTVLAHVLKVLNTRHDYNLELLLLSVDEGIIGYRDDSLKAVKMNQIEYNLPLKVVSYDEMYGGWTMDKVVSTVGRRHNCTFCGVFRRQALDRGAAQLDADKVATGHNADDLAETVLMNLLRGDVPRLIRCVDIVTGAEGSLPRCKPLKYCFEKEIVMYARFLNLTYFATECIYSPEAFRGHLRAYVKDIERIRPRSILDIIESAEQLTANSSARLPVQVHTWVSCSRIIGQGISNFGHIPCRQPSIMTNHFLIGHSTVDTNDLPQAAIRNSVKPEDQNQKSSTLEQFQSLQVSGNGCGNCDCDGTRKVEI